jgi:hypothetical protein
VFLEGFDDCPLLVFILVAAGVDLLLGGVLVPGAVDLEAGAWLSVTVAADGGVGEALPESLGGSLDLLPLAPLAVLDDHLVLLARDQLGFRPSHSATKAKINKS